MYGINDTKSVPENLTTLCWNDGANIQLAVIVNEKQQQADETKKICTYKHSASLTAVEQACECRPVFRSPKAIRKNLTKEDSPHLGLQKIFAGELRKHERGGILKLIATNNSALLDFLSCFPSILSKSSPHDDVVLGL